MDLSKIIEFAKIIPDFSSSVISFSTYFPEVHMTNEAFIKCFSGRPDIEKIRHMDDSDYPYEYRVKEQGVKFFCLSKTPEFGDFDD